MVFVDPTELRGGQSVTVSLDVIIVIMSMLGSSPASLLVSY